MHVEGGTHAGLYRRPYVLGTLSVFLLPCSASINIAARRSRSNRRSAVCNSWHSSARTCYEYEAKHRLKRGRALSAPLGSRLSFSRVIMYLTLVRFMVLLLTANTTVLHMYSEGNSL